jgi:thiol-disulfide isomerase/thioredoxin
MKYLAALMFAAGASVALVASAGASTTTLAPVLAAGDWLNGRVAADDLAGKVVVVDVFTFGCINCQHVVPALRRLHASVSPNDLAIVGVHAPETPEERNRANVVRELASQGIVWPVALDNSFTVWKALGNEYWPTQYIFDRHGTLRRTVVGEGEDEVVNETVRRLVAEH